MILVKEPYPIVVSLIFGQKKALIERSGLNKYGTYLLSRDESQYHRP